MKNMIKTYMTFLVGNSPHNKPVKFGRRIFKHPNSIRHKVKCVSLNSEFGMFSASLHNDVICYGVLLFIIFIFYYFVWCLILNGLSRTPHGRITIFITTAADLPSRATSLTYARARLKWAVTAIQAKGVTVNFVSYEHHFFKSRCKVDSVRIDIVELNINHLPLDNGGGK